MFGQFEVIIIEFCLEHVMNRDFEEVEVGLVDFDDLLDLVILHEEDLAVVEEHEESEHLELDPTGVEEPVLFLHLLGNQ